jgi:hypothetical protein
LIEGSTSIEQWVNLIRLAGFDDRPAFLDHAQVYLVLCSDVVALAGIRLNCFRLLRRGVILMARARPPQRR